MPRAAMDRAALAQGAYFLATGLWPILHMRSFEAVTGPKTDRWLVKTAGALIAAAGATLLLAGARRRTTREVAFLGAAQSAALTAIDFYYPARGRISPIYAAEGILEAGIALGWVALLRREGVTPAPAPAGA